jgi:hypothetical protein
MNAQERLAYLLESVWVPTNKQVLFADITGAVGLEATALVVGTIKAAAASNPIMDTIIIAMSTNGLSLSTAERQGVIDSLAIAGEWPDAVRDAVKALGGINRPRWQSEGYSSEPTLEQITIELAKQDWRERFDAILNQIGTVEQADGVAALRVMADEMEAV